MIYVKDDRDLEIISLAKQFEYDHLPLKLRTPSILCHDLAAAMIENLPDSIQLKQGLWDLLRAKDCFVRALVERK